jgi:gamma-glutamylcyclotransferase (GGCT)/AIG2-like uncharacterized protein YtfP
MDPHRMGERCPHSPLRTTGWLLGWRLTFGGEQLGWDGALATIVEDPIEQVFVAVYDVTDEDAGLLDGWESADSGLYRKTRVRVTTLLGEEHGWDGALPTLVQDPLEQVYVAVYDVGPKDESALDGWEQADSGLYRKTKVRVATMNGELVVWTYVLDAYEGGLPSAVTLGVLADAAEAADAPDDYVAGLRRRPCRSTGL